MHEFPDSRENNREFCEFAAILAVPDVNSRSDSNWLRANSLRALEQGIFSPDQGIHLLEQGIVSSD
jgi:hypothetical protein